MSKPRFTYSWLKRGAPLLFLSLFIASLIVTIIPAPKKASALTSAQARDLLAKIDVYYQVEHEKCNFKVKKSLSGEDYVKGKADLLPNVLINEANEKLNTNRLSDSVLGKGDNEKINCLSLFANNIVKDLYGGNEQFIQKFYDLSKGPPYNVKRCDSGAGDDCWQDSVIERDIKKWNQDNLAKVQDFYPVYVYQVAMSAFNECYEWKNDKDPIKFPTKESAIGHPELYDRDFWSNKDGPDSKTVGYIVEASAGGFEDGVLGCRNNELFNYVKDMRYLDKSEESLLEDANTSFRAKELKELFNSNDDGIRFCTAGFPSLTEKSVSTLINQIANWLSNTNNPLLNNDISGPPSPSNYFPGLNADESVRLKDCVLIAYGKAAKDILSININPDAGTAIDNINNGDENKATCENKGGALGWIICPVIRMISNALDKVEALIENLLQTNSDKIQKGGDAYKVWLNFRNIAYVGIVIAMLVMIIGTALDLEIVGAYTVKKVLPRLVISVILISLSWNICLFFIDFVDLLGRGVMGILTAPFGGDSLTLSSSIEVTGGFGFKDIDTFITGIGAGLGIIAILAFFWQVILLFALLTLMVLILRQSMIFLLVVLSPIAFVAWIFPGTQKLWKMWSDNFTKLMLMFPMIVALIASGRIFASLIGKGDFSGLTETIQVVAYMVPYAVIPFTFKFAGGMMAFAGGAIMNNKATQFANKAAMGRGIGKAKRTYERTSTGNIFRNAPTDSIRGRINRYAAGAANINKAGLRPSNWRTNMGTFLDDQEVANSLEHAEKDASYQSWKSDDSLNRAALIASREGRDIREILRERGYAGFGDANVNQDQAEAAIESAARRTERTRKGMNERAFQMMAWQGAVRGGTAYAEEETGQMLADAAGIAGDDDSVLASLVARGRDAAMAGGRVDQGGAGFGVTLDAARAIRDRTMRPDQAAASIHQGVLNAQGPAVLAHSSMKPQALRALMPMMRERLIQAYDTGDQEVIDRELASIESLEAQFRMAGNVQNSRILEDEVLNWHPTMSAMPLPPGVAGPEPPRTPLPNDEYGPAAPSLRATIRSDLQRRRSSPGGAASLEAYQRQQAAQNARGGDPNPRDPMNPGSGT